MEQNADSRFERFLGLIAAIDKEIMRIRAAECANYGLRGSELMCLHQLGNERAGLTSADLARRTGVTRAAMSRTVAALEERGLVSVGEQGAAESGRYRALVRLTELGQALMGEVAEAIAQVMDEVTPALSEDERAALYASLETLLGCLKGIAR